MALLGGPFGKELKYKSKMLNDFVGFSTLLVVVLTTVDFSDDLRDCSRSLVVIVVNGRIVDSISVVVSMNFEVVVIGTNLVVVLGGCVTAGLGSTSFSS